MSHMLKYIYKSVLGKSLMLITDESCFEMHIYIALCKLDIVDEFYIKCIHDCQSSCKNVLTFTLYFVSCFKILLKLSHYLLLSIVHFQDGLLSQGYGDLINRLHEQIPKVTSDSKRLQMIVCSATLHSFEVKKMAVSK